MHAFRHVTKNEVFAFDPWPMTSCKALIKSGVQLSWRWKVTFKAMLNRFGLNVSPFECLNFGVCIKLRMRVS